MSVLKSFPGNNRFALPHRAEIPAMWMGGLPTILSMFIALMVAPYTIMKSAATVSDLLALIENRKQP